jgi:type IV fimbrial biogenesis protein FimT
MNPLPLTRRQRGLTLIESCIVLVIVAVVLGFTMPSFQQARERRHVEGASAQLRTDIAHARSTAVARNQNVRIGFGAAAACYVVHTGAAGDCTCTANGSARCSADAELLQHVVIDSSSSVSLTSNSASMLFDGSLGTVTPTGTVKVVGRNGAAIHLVVSVMGRVRACAPAPGLPGYAAC